MTPLIRYKYCNFSSKCLIIHKLKNENTYLFTTKLFMKKLIIYLILAAFFSLNTLAARFLDIDVSEGLAAFQGYKLKTNSHIGASVSKAGDFNGDGIDDMIIGLPSSDPLNRGAAGTVYIIFGNREGHAEINFHNPLENTKGFKILGSQYNDALGRDVSNAGDVNGDGIDDIIISAHTASIYEEERYGAGFVYVLFGSKSEHSDIDLNATLPNNKGFKIIGPQIGYTLGTSVSGAGDVNGDGIDDIIIGASLTYPGGRSAAGTVYIIFGSKSAFSDIDLKNTLPVDKGIKIVGNAGDGLGSSVSNAGDLNGDGVGDIIIGAHLASPSKRWSAGTAYVIFGNKNGLSDIDLKNSLPRTQGFKILGPNNSSLLGKSVNHAGDVNGDNIDDIIIGAPMDSTAYVIYGRKDGFDDIDFTNPISKSQGFKITGAKEDNRFGNSVSSAGDMNGDGADDLILGSYFSSPSSRQLAGTAYVIFGRKGGLSNIDLNDPLGKTQGFKIIGGSHADNLGVSVSHGGDLNGDGVDDIIVGANYDNPIKSVGTGTVFIIYSSKNIVDEEEIANILEGSSGFIRGVIGAFSLIVPGDASAIAFGMLAKMIQYIRYIQIHNSIRLEGMFRIRKTSSGSLAFLPKMTDSMRDDFENKDALPEIFAKYDLYPSFLVNYWDSFISLIIVWFLFTALYLGSQTLEKKKKNSAITNIVRKARTTTQNFFLTSFYSSFGDVVFFALIEFQTIHFKTFLSIFSLFVAILFLILGLSVLAMHFRLVKEHQGIVQRHRSAGNDREELTNFEKKNEGMQVLFLNFKERSLDREAFLLIAVVRTILFNIVVSSLYNFYLLQVILIVLMNILMLGYISFTRPLKRLVDLVQNIFIEVLLLTVNITTLVSSSLDAAGKENSPQKEGLADVVIFCNILCTVLPPIFIAVKVYLILRNLYLEKKAAKQGAKLKGHLETNNLQLYSRPGSSASSHHRNYTNPESSLKEPELEKRSSLELIVQHPTDLERSPTSRKTSNISMLEQSPRKLSNISMWERSPALRKASDISMLERGSQESIVNSSQDNMVILDLQDTPFIPNLFTGSSPARQRAASNHIRRWLKDSNRVLDLKVKEEKRNSPEKSGEE